MSDEPRLAMNAAELRRAFDRTFAEAPAALVERGEDLLSIGVGSGDYAVRLAEVLGLFVDRKIVSVPSRAPGLLGVTGLRTGIVPVYDLASLLGRAATSDAPRWLLLTSEGVALGFDRFDGYARVERAAIAADASHAHVRDAARIAGAMRVIISLPSVIGRIRELVGVGSTKEP